MSKIGKRVHFVYSSQGRTRSYVNGNIPAGCLYPTCSLLQAAWCSAHGSHLHRVECVDVLLVFGHLRLYFTRFLAGGDSSEDFGDRVVAFRAP